MKYTKLIILTFVLVLATLSYGVAQDIGLESRLSNSSLTVKNKIEVYPNPAVEFLIVQISNSEMENVEFEMYSLIGNKIVIKPEQIGTDKYRISVKDFSSGYYFILVKDEKKRFEKALKFLKN
ncbi:MAG: T9SS type A sorting domain-containing protein [Bacteroidota bacterium]